MKKKKPNYQKLLTISQNIASHFCEAEVVFTEKTFLDNSSYYQNNKIYILKCNNYINKENELNCKYFFTLLFHEIYHAKEGKRFTKQIFQKTKELGGKNKKEEVVDKIKKLIDDHEKEADRWANKKYNYYFEQSKENYKEFEKLITTKGKYYNETHSR